MGRNSHVRGYAPPTAYGAKLRLTNVRKWPKAVIEEHQKSEQCCPMLAANIDGLMSSPSLSF
jgi:hypothetical protein